MTVRVREEGGVRPCVEAWLARERAGLSWVCPNHFEKLSVSIVDSANPFFQERNPVKMWHEDQVLLYHLTKKSKLLQQLRSILLNQLLDLSIQVVCFKKSEIVLWNWFKMQHCLLFILLKAFKSTGKIVNIWNYINVYQENVATELEVYFYEVHCAARWEMRLYWQSSLLWKCFASQIKTSFERRIIDFMKS